MEDDLRKCTDARGLSELLEMLVASGHVRQPSSRVKPRKEAPSQPMKFRSCDGIEMEVGKNALQNERLTMGARQRNMAARAEDAGLACADSHGGRRAGVYADAGGHALRRIIQKAFAAHRCRLTRRCAGISKNRAEPRRFCYLHPPENAVYHPERSGNQEN